MIKLDLSVENGEVESNIEQSENVARADRIGLVSGLAALNSGVNITAASMEPKDVSTITLETIPLTADARCLYNQNNLCGSPTRMIIGVHDHECLKKTKPIKIAVCLRDIFTNEPPIGGGNVFLGYLDGTTEDLILDPQQGKAVGGTTGDFEFDIIPPFEITGNELTFMAFYFPGDNVYKAALRFIKVEFK